MNIHDFGTRLIELHAGFFGRASLLTLAERIQLPIRESQVTNVLTEWLLFGVYAVRQSVAAKCGRDTALRDAILDEFFEQFYTGMRKAGIPESELPHLEHCIKARFLEYDHAQLSPTANPAQSLGQAASRLMFADDKHAIVFAAFPTLQFGDCMESIGRLFDELKIKR